MSSTSIARQNRRKRLKQNLNIFGADSKQTVFSVPELNSTSEQSTNSDKESNAQSVRKKSDSSFIKSSRASKQELYETVSYAASCDFLNNDISSRPLEKIFIEGDRGFKEINASQIFQITHPEVSIQSNDNELINLAFQIAKYFHSLSNFCHGLLGGISLLYIFVLLHLFSNLLIDEDTIKYFSFFSKPIHNLFNFLCTVCSISVFDRFDVTNTVDLFKLIRKLDFKLITLLIYPVCLLLSLSTANVDDKLSMPSQNGSMWESLNFKEESEIYYWKTLSLSKCFGALLGWMVLCWDQNFNLLLDHIKSILLRRKMSLH